MTDSPTTTLLVYMSAAEKRAVKQRALDEGITAAALVRRALRRELEALALADTERPDANER